MVSVRLCPVGCGEPQRTASFEVFSLHMRFSALTASYETKPGSAGAHPYRLLRKKPLTWVVIVLGCENSRVPQHNVNCHCEEPPATKQSQRFMKG
jgi:hypothetical protein